MTARAYAGWIREYAEQCAADRRAVVEFARAAPPDLWALPARDGDWTRKDVLAHLAGGNDQLSQIIFSAAIEDRALAPSDLEPDTDAENARGVEERRGWSIDRLIDELERDGADYLDLLARLTDDHASVRPANAPWTLRDMVRAGIRERHDLEHLAQIRD